MKIKTIIGTVATVTTIALATPAYADFYDGASLPPEKNWQVHLVGSTSGLTTITKYIPADGNTVSIAAVGETEGKLHHGLAQGYRFDMPFGDGNYLGILPMVQGSIGTDAAGVVPTLYTTLIAGKCTVDPRVQTPMTVQYNGEATLDAVVVGNTIGLQVADSLRIGPDAQVNFLAPKESLQVSALLRYDPKGANGNHWMELQLGTDTNGNASSAVQYRINF
ncbi:hypothetical protein COV16_03375 [Candidatus Woesearchaeota archaeon CG10_big_fil_rev_8_21_14_0_10_34_8]|nr:MAG: hypothetical protein COV16_03375 [Candidatus Woesearchaeota archaeon CG10_big_fil_rev_8_21_14_0_10_34_8]